ncbi:hypothetical protein LMG3410_00536 [Achromobacter aegrifaciens]|nr:hypothetical protein LMG3410_00536 [Achromobacter aegrifaciens]
MRNPPWSRDELILALDLYLKHRSSLPGHESPEVIELSKLLNRMTGALGRSKADTYRNVNGVYMKLMNFRRLDPLYIHSGKKGLTRGNKDESEVWDFFSSNAAQLAQVCNAIRKGSSRDDILELEDEEACDAPEGRILTRLHRYRERNKELVRKAKQAALKKHGRLACEACGFDFSAVYGPRGEGLIDAHHTKPLHTVADDHRSNIEDLALLCANCHRIVHARREWLTMQELRKLVRTNM